MRKLAIALAALTGACLIVQECDAFWWISSDAQPNDTKQNEWKKLKIIDWDAHWINKTWASKIFSWDKWGHDSNRSLWSPWEDKRLKRKSTNCFLKFFFCKPDTSTTATGNTSTTSTTISPPITNGTTARSTRVPNLSTQIPSQTTTNPPRTMTTSSQQGNSTPSANKTTTIGLDDYVTDDNDTNNTRPSNISISNQSKQRDSSPKSSQSQKRALRKKRSFHFDWPFDKPLERNSSESTANSKSAKRSTRDEANENEKRGPFDRWAHNLFCRFNRHLKKCQDTVSTTPASIDARKPNITTTISPTSMTTTAASITTTVAATTLRMTIGTSNSTLTSSPSPTVSSTPPGTTSSTEGKPSTNSTNVDPSTLPSPPTTTTAANANSTTPAQTLLSPTKALPIRQ